MSSDYTFGHIEAALNDLGRSQLVALRAKIDEILTVRNIQTGSIEDLDPSVRLYNALRRGGIESIEDVTNLLLNDPDKLLSLRNFGPYSLQELAACLNKKGYISDKQAASFLFRPEIKKDKMP